MRVMIYKRTEGGYQTVILPRLEAKTPIVVLRSATQEGAREERKAAMTMVGAKEEAVG